MDEFPTMPDDWWPDGGIIVLAKDDKNELCFAITETAYFDNLIKEQLTPSLIALRQCLWNYKNLSAEDKQRYYGPRYGLEEKVDGTSPQV